jgi:hypothetical protein
MNRVEQGEEPMGIIRDPAENEPMIDLHREGKRLQGFHTDDKQSFDDSFRRARELASIRG